MHTPRPLALAVPLVFALVLTACAGGTASPTPPASPEPIDSAEEAAALAAEQNPLFAGIPRRDPDLIGQAHWWTATELGAPGDEGGWRVTFRAGWGDCPAGCINEHTWTYEVTPGGEVTFVSEEGPELPPEVVEELRRAGQG